MARTVGFVWSQQCKHTQNNIYCKNMFKLRKNCFCSDSILILFFISIQIKLVDESFSCCSCSCGSFLFAIGFFRSYGICNFSTKIIIVNKLTLNGVSYSIRAVPFCPKIVHIMFRCTNCMCRRSIPLICFK